MRPEILEYGFNALNLDGNRSRYRASDVERAFTATSGMIQNGAWPQESQKAALYVSKNVVIQSVRRR